IMELTCPCGNGILIKNVTTKGPNVTRPYYKCPGSQKGNNIPDCKFYSFEDELKQCPCGRGFCRTAFIRKEKFWCCCVQGLGDCGFMMRITSTWQLPRDWNSNPQSSSAASQSSSAASQSPSAQFQQFQSPSTQFQYPSAQVQSPSGQWHSFTPSATFQSSSAQFQSPSSPLMHTPLAQAQSSPPITQDRSRSPPSQVVLLTQSLKVAQSSVAAYLNLIENMN
ncbi:hypothetical protein BVRB_019550, partial [Beta vulgaris subsp. vulgaris]